jgi:hypothetical protein
VRTARYGELNVRSRLAMTVAPPGTSKCHPSSCGATKPAQLPVGVKVAAMIGVGVAGSSWIWYGLPLATVDPVPAVATTAVPATKMPTPATSPAMRHPVKRAVLLNTGSLPGYPARSRRCPAPYFSRRKREGVADRGMSSIMPGISDILEFCFTTIKAKFCHLVAHLVAEQCHFRGVICPRHGR